MLYFAYGSNLSHKQITARCPSSVFVAPARLKEYRFIFSGYSPRWGSSVANIAKDAEGTVHGALFEMSENDLEHLAGLEGSQGYSQVDVMVEHAGISKMARTFISTDTTLGQPSDDYLNTMKLGAEDCELPEKYIESLEV